MRLKKPTRAIIDQVRITREGNDAIIDYADSGIAGTRLTIGPDLATMTDRDIIDVFNGILAAQERILAACDKTVTEEPPGEKQIDYHEDSDQWVPLRAISRKLRPRRSPRRPLAGLSDSATDTLPLLPRHRFRRLGFRISTFGFSDMNSSGTNAILIPQPA